MRTKKCRSARRTSQHSIISAVSLFNAQPDESLPRCNIYENRSSQDEAQYYTKQQKNAEYSHRLIGLPDLTPPSFKEEQKYIIVAKVMYVQREVTI